MNYRPQHRCRPSKGRLYSFGCLSPSSFFRMCLRTTSLFSVHMITWLILFTTEGSCPERQQRTSKKQTFFVNYLTGTKFVLVLIDIFIIFYFMIVFLFDLFFRNEYMGWHHFATQFSIKKKKIMSCQPAVCPQARVNKMYSCLSFVRK